MWRIRNLFNLAPASYYKFRLRSEQERASAAITELRAIEAFLNANYPGLLGQFRVNKPTRAA